MFSQKVRYKPALSKILYLQFVGSVAAKKTSLKKKEGLQNALAEEPGYPFWEGRGLVLAESHSSLNKQKVNKQAPRPVSKLCDEHTKIVWVKKLETIHPSQGPAIEEWVATKLKSMYKKKRKKEGREKSEKLGTTN